MIEANFYYVVSFAEHSRVFATFEAAKLFSRLASRLYDASVMGISYLYGGVEIWSYDLDGDFSEMEEPTEEELEYELESFFGPRE